MVVSFPKKWKMRLPSYNFTTDVGVGAGVTDTVGVGVGVAVGVGVRAGVLGEHTMRGKVSPFVASVTCTGESLSRASI